MTDNPITAPNKHTELRKELSNPSIGSNHHLRKLALSLLDELEVSESKCRELAALGVRLPNLPVLGSTAEWYEGFAAGASSMRNECANAIRAAGIGLKGE